VAETAEGNLRIALLQLRAVPDEEAFARAESACREAARLGADIALLPEMWSIGYRVPDPEDPAGAEAFRRRALAPDAPPLRRMGAIAAELRLAIGATYLEARPGRPRNALRLFDRHGAAVLDYAKVHTCAFDRERLLEPGDGFPVAALDTAAGPVAVGAMICFDREFPESARLLMLAGAELILVPNACAWDAPRDHQLESRAFENMAAIALCNYAAPDQDGGSTAFDGMAFAADGRAREMRLCRAGQEEAVLLADLDLGALRAYRSREVWGPQWRRPKTYGPLVEAIPPNV